MIKLNAWNSITFVKTVYNFNTCVPDLAFLLQLHLLEIGLNNILQISFTKYCSLRYRKCQRVHICLHIAVTQFSHSITATCGFSALAFCPKSNNSTSLYRYLSDTFIGAKYITLTIPSRKTFYVTSIIKV